MTLTAQLHRDTGDRRPGGDVAAAPQTPQAAREETPMQPETLPRDAEVTAGETQANAPGGILAVIRHAIRQGRRQARDMSAREGGWVNGLLSGKTPSVNEQRDYAANKRWLPPGHEGGIADREGEAFQVAIGIPGVAIGNLISATSARQFRFLIAFAVFLAVVFAVTQWAGLAPAAGVLIIAALLAALAIYIGVVGLLLAAPRAIGRRLRPAERKTS